MRGPGEVGLPNSDEDNVLLKNMLLHIFLNRDLMIKKKKNRQNEELFWPISYTESVLHRKNNNFDHLVKYL